MTGISHNILLLRQGIETVSSLVPELYSAAVEAEVGPGASEGHPRSSIGSHFRHCLDCYACFLAGLEEGRIDYDARARDLEIERNTKTAIAEAESIISSLSRILDQDPRRGLLVRVDETDQCKSDDAEWTVSSLGRELKFLLSHTIHHYALIATVLRNSGVEPRPDFGVAPSTSEHQQSRRAPSLQR